MDTKTFLQSVLGSEGSYCVWANRTRDGRRVQKFYPSIDAVIHAATNLDTEGYDVYFALATFDDTGSREASHAVQLRALFIDLDCGPGKSYETQHAAVLALRDFCRQVKLPRPALVNSGRGIHAYWRLAEPVGRDAWLAIAERLKILCKRLTLHADPVVTADAARVLRVPGTRNYKNDPPSPVELLQDGVATPIDALSQILGSVEEAGALPPAPRRFTPRESDSIMEALSGSIVSRFKTIMMKTVNGKGCAQLGDIVQGQAQMSEPLWRAGLSIAKFCTDGGKAIHRISDKYPGYSFEATEEKAARIKGPYLCERFDEYRSGVCHNCTHWQKIKSPIALGREVLEATESDNVVLASPEASTAVPVEYVIPKFPSPFFRGKEGGVFKRGSRVVDEHGELNEEASKDKTVYLNDLYVTRRLSDSELGELIVMRLHLPKDGVREFTIPLAAVGSKDEFRKYLAMHGVAVLNVSDLMEYTMRWVNELQFASEAEEAHRQFGWLTEDGNGFALGNTLVYKDRVEVNAASSATLGMFPYFRPKGTFDNWKETMRFYNREGMEAHQFMVGLSFGAILMQFQPLNAAAFHLHSKDSGFGKTTGMLAGASVWGDPDLLMMQERDTYNTKMNRAEVYKNLPCYMDEMTNTKPQDLSDWAYQLPSGLQRNRMGAKSNVERVRGKPWKTLFGTTGNTSLIERIGVYKALPKAEAQRILECRAERVIFSTKAETDRFVTDIKDNYGHAGIPFLQYVMNNVPSVIELANTTQMKIDVAAGLTAENRFWSVLVSRTLAGLMLAKKMDLIDWKLAPIVAFAVKTIAAQQTIVKDMNIDAEATLTDYLAENYNSLLRIKSTDDARRNDSGLEHLIHPDSTPRGNAFIARYEYDIKKLYLLPKPLKAWCARQQINYAGLLEDLKGSRTQATKVKMRLSKGTRMNLPAVDVIMVDCKDFMNDEGEQILATTAAMFQKQNSGE